MSIIERWPDVVLMIIIVLLVFAVAYVWIKGIGRDK